MFKTILLAIDLNDPASAEKATAAAQKMTLDNDAVLHVVNVVPDNGMAMVGAAMGAERGKAMMQEVDTALHAFAEQHLPAVMNATLHVEQGTVYDRILRKADAVGADLIIVGSHRPELKDYLIGPNSARIARHAKAAVLVLR